MANYLEGLSDEVKRACEHAKWVADGSVPFHGDFASATPSVLNKLKWWIQEIKKERDKERSELICEFNKVKNALAAIHDIVGRENHGTIKANIDCTIKGVSDLREVINHSNLKIKMARFLERFISQQRCHGGSDPDHVCLWCDANSLLKEFNQEI